MKITFLGATETVTGSRYLLEHKGKKILIDCGLFQGHKEMRQRNWAQFPIDPSAIDAVVLTHSHIDHSGYIPLLVKNGFRGKIFCSEATFDLCKILLPDSGFLQEEDAQRANRYKYSKHTPAIPLYTEEDAQQSLKNFQVVAFNKKQNFDDNFYFTLSNSGHILGSAFVNVFYNNQNIVFSGDLGRSNDAIMKPPVHLEHADYLLIESTYGNRLHEKTDPAQVLKDVINKTVARGGIIVIPAFAVGRAQNVMFYLHQLKKEKAIPDLPIFLDSPMAVSAAKILQKHVGEHKLSEKLCDEICETVHYIRTVEESKNLAHIKMPMVIISASGMAEGGRVLHHLKNYITDYKNTILFTGFQAEGTRGSKILRGDKEVKIHGGFYSVNAEIVNLGNNSAHADYEEILDWLSNFKTAPKKTFITHGSIESAISLKEKIEKKFGWDVEIPKYLQSEELSKQAIFLDEQPRVEDELKRVSTGCTKYEGMTQSLNSLGFLRSKIYGNELTAYQIEEIISDIALEYYSDIQISAFLTACANGHLSKEEILNITKSMVQVGNKIEWSEAVIVDKHCVGGLPGNRTTPIVVPIVAAFGMMMPKTSSRAITSPSGTADTIEVLTSVEFTVAEIKKIVEQEKGCMVWGGLARLSPADDILIRVEIVLDVDSEGQMVASILSKKIAAGSNHILIEIPVGKTAKVRSAFAAEILKNMLEETGKNLGITVKTILTDGSQPVGNGIGPALEARDVVAVLQNYKNAPQDLRERALVLAGEILEFSSDVKNGTGKILATEILESGKAWQKFQAICMAQGGLKEIPQTKFIYQYLALQDGTVYEINNRQVALMAKIAGAPLDKTAGVDLFVKIGSTFKKDSALFAIHSNSEAALHSALNYFSNNLNTIQITEK